MMQVKTLAVSRALFIDETKKIIELIRNYVVYYYRDGIEAQLEVERKA